MSGMKGWTLVVGSWVVFIAGGLVIAGYEVSYGSLIDESIQLVAQADRWLTDARLLAAVWVDAGRSAVDGVASLLSGVDRCI